MLSNRVYAPIAEQAEKLGIFGHGYTYSAHPVCAAVALRTQKIMHQRNIVSHVQNVAPIFKKHLATMKKYDFIGDARAVGLIGALEFIFDKKENRKFDPEHRIALQAVAMFQKQGVILRALPGDIIGFCPPLIISESELNDMFRRVDIALQELADVVSKLK